MSTAAETAATPRQRGAQATRELGAALGLGVLGTADLRYLALALVQAANEEVSRNADFAERIRSLYEATRPRPAAPATASRGSARRGATATWSVKLTPVGTADEALLDPYGPPNPFALQQIYGDEQLARALERYTPARLRDAVALVQQRYPGTKPAKMTKAAIIDYIVRTIASPVAASRTE